MLTRCPKSSLDLVVAGTSDAVLMVESEAKELSEDVMLGAVMFGHKSFQPVIDAIIKLAEAAAKEPRDFTAGSFRARSRNARHVRSRSARRLQDTDKAERYAAIDEAKAKVKEHFAPEEARAPLHVRSHRRVFKSLQAKVVRGPSSRPRAASTAVISRPVRPIVSEVGVLPRTHGSAAVHPRRDPGLVVATLGTGEDEQFVDALTGHLQGTFMLHYNFPPYSVGETGRTGSPGRREIGHGKLAWRAVHPMLPPPRSSPTRCAWSPRSPNPTARPRWRPSAAPRWR
jgi:polyribonucleotide nucleotidyltransferase